MKITFNNRTIKRLEETTNTALKLNNFRLFKIAKSLLMVATDIRISDIAKFFKVSERTIYNWFLRFLYEQI